MYLFVFSNTLFLVSEISKISWNRLNLIVSKQNQLKILKTTMAISASTGVLYHVDGSSQFESNNTKVVCSVTGPIEPKARQELPTQLALEIIVRPARGVPNTREKLMEDRLRAVLTPLIARYMYPRKLCQITFQIMEAGESELEFTQRELSACINSATLALIDAGIGLYGMACSVPLAVIEGAIIVDPTDSQLQASQSVHTLALEITEGGKKSHNILLLDSTGDFTDTELFDGLQKGEQECLELVQELRKVVADRITSDIIRTKT
ncbi:RRP46 (YGR095C) [Zygosaccharomyces parabailii]|nr:RRP46 (YGR095C) [Zygosaccharomyces parabailii]